MKRFNVLHALAVLFVFSLTTWGLVPNVSEGAVPQLINFQGIVKDSAGNTPAVDMLSVTFTIYDAPLGGLAFWTETQTITIAAGGLFSVLLGSTNPIPDSVFADTVRWLGIQVETDPEMLPRQQLVSVGYAYRVGTVDGASGGTINGAIDAPGMSSKIRFHYNDVSEFPSAATYHGMFAHAHNQGAAYYAHAAQWVRLADSAHPHSSLAASDLSPNPALSVDADGNVGIGTTSPSRRLAIVDPGVGLDRPILNNLAIYTGNTERMRIDANGNVGIGTASPVARLTVAGGNVLLDNSSATTGNILKGGNRFIHNFGVDNTFIGVNAGNLTMSGAGNTASGPAALQLNTTGSSNTASGYGVLAVNSTGDYNTGTGYAALAFNTAGDSNTAIGFRALQSNTTGGNNTASGGRALYNNTTGSNNTAIGYLADVSAGNLTNATAIGSGAVADASNKVRLGNSTVTVIEGEVAYTFTSDRNEKENFRPVNGVEVLKKIRGFELTSWNYKGHDPKQFRHYGPMAQDFFAAFGDDGIGKIGTPTTLNSGDVAGILMAAVQTLGNENAGLKARIERLEEKLAAMQAEKPQSNTK